MILAAEMAPEGSSPTCREDYQTYLWVRGALMITAFFATGSAIVLLVKQDGPAMFLRASYGILSILVSLALAGVVIWGFVITYRPDGNTCMNSRDYSERMTTLWINISGWLSGAVSIAFSAWVSIPVNVTTDSEA